MFILNRFDFLLKYDIIVAYCKRAKFPYSNHGGKNMEGICGCRVVSFGAKPTGFVLEVNYNEANEANFVIKKYIQKEVEEHLEYEEEDYIQLDNSKAREFGLEELVEYAKKELEEKCKEQEELAIHAAVVHEMCVRLKE